MLDQDETNETAVLGRLNARLRLPAGFGPQKGKERK